MKVKTVYAICLQDESVISSTAAVLCVAETYNLAYEYLNNRIRAYVNGEYVDVWDVINDYTDNVVRLERRKDGERIALYIQTMSYLTK